MNKHFNKTTTLLIFSCFQISVLFGQTANNSSKEIEAKIKQVESNLTGVVQIENIPPFKWTLAERLKFYHANGISITVIKDYKIE